MRKRVFKAGPIQSGLYIVECIIVELLYHSWEKDPIVFSYIPGDFFINLIKWSKQSNYEGIQFTWKKLDFQILIKNELFK